MSQCILFEDGNIINNYNGILWDGLFSKVKSNGKIIKYLQSCLPKNTIFIIPKSDGNINSDNNINKWNDIDWKKEIEPYMNYAKRKNKVFIIGTLCQIDEEKDCNYLYLPLDDTIFEYGINYFFNKENLPLWECRSSELCWRGGCSGVGNLNSLRVKFVEKIYNYNPNTDIRLSNYWSENKNIPIEYLKERIDYNEFLKYKIFFIIDGNCIASNNMYGFSTGCIPFLITNSICWFSKLLVPYVHYIPIKYDLNNLIENIEWVKNNDDKAKIIADNALKFSEIYFSSDYQKKYIKEKIEKICSTIIDKKIIDCFTFYNEMDLLFYRLTLLYDFVDYFIIVESNYTHAGNKKILYFQENKNLFKRFENKIIHIVVDLPYIYPNIDYLKEEQWKNENYQRNCINLGIEKITLKNDDLIIISDLDEIVNPEILLKLKNNLFEIKSGGFNLLQDMYYYNLNTKHDDKWLLSKIVTYEKYITSTPQEIRMNNKFPFLKNSGWHLSYFGNKEFIKNKLKEFSHQEYNFDLYTNEENIEYKINNNIDLFNRNNIGIKLIIL